MRKIFIILSIIFFTHLLGQHIQNITPDRLGLKYFFIQDEKLGEINFYITKNKIKHSKPLLIILDGSGNSPLFLLLIKKDRRHKKIISRIPFNYNKISEKYHVVLISKPGIPFSDILEVNSFKQIKKKYKPTKEYIEKISLEWRVSSTSKIINYLQKKIKIKDNKVIVIGVSEGGQVVPKLALKNKKITKIVSIVGSGLNQCYDFIILERIKAEKGIITNEQAQKKIDSLYSKFKEIYNNPNETNKFWLGHTYKRWASFCNDIALKNLLKLDIPILIIANVKDKNSPILGLDYIKLEFIKRKKTNLIYKVYPNCDHFFNDKKLGMNKMNEMIKYVMDWIKK